MFHTFEGNISSGGVNTITVDKQQLVCYSNQDLALLQEYCVLCQLDNADDQAKTEPKLIVALLAT